MRTIDITLLGLLVVVAVVGALATAIGFNAGKQEGERQASAIPRAWCTEYTLFSDEGRVCRYSAPDGSEYIIGKETLRRYLQSETLTACPKRVRICFVQTLNLLQVTRVEVL